MKARQFSYGLILFVLLMMSVAMSKSASSASYSLTILHTSDLTDLLAQVVWVGPSS